MVFYKVTRVPRETCRGKGPRSASRRFKTEDKARAYESKVANDLACTKLVRTAICHKNEVNGDECQTFSTVTN